MIFFTVISALFFTVVTSGNINKDENCLDIIKPENIQLTCCKGLKLFQPSQYGCVMSNDSVCTSDWPCDAEKCVMEKLGVLLPNGTMNEDEIKSILEDTEIIAPQHHAVLSRLKNECLGKKYRHYAPTGVCDSVKFFICSYVHTLLECPAWIDSSECLKVKDLTQSCKYFVNAMISEIVAQNKLHQ